MSVILGKDVETGRTLAVGDTERCGGLYLLGKPRTGKSTLLISLALQDIEHGHGLLFIDPHADAIAALLARIPDKRAKDVILLDPMTEEYAFGINPLTCKNPKSYKELAFSYGLARDVFVKVFGNPQTGELGILLDKYLRNTLYPLLENPGYTLVDIESFLINPLFRNRLLQNVSMNPAVVRFWQEQYEQLTYKDKIEERESTLNRLNIILAEPHVRHIVGQVKTTIDFTEILRTQKIVLLRMPAGMDEGIKTFIGTLIISQLLKAVWLRQEMPEEARGLFALYCDEFQHFATPDFAKLFTQTGKFKIMPTVAHQERLGQFKQQDPNRGATLAAPNKVLFSLSVADSKELAPEFAKPPPTETRREQELVISQNPVSDLLRGHSNPRIRAFVDQYLRPLQERTEDIREDMELERLTRDDYRDRAGIERILAQINAPKSRYDDSSAQLSALEAAMSSLLFARTQTEKLAGFLKSSKELRQTIRGFNRFLTGIVEGRIARGQEIFSQFLIAITRVREFSLVPEECRPVLELYLTLQYGDPAKAPALPFGFAQAHGFFPDTVCKLIQQREYLVRREKEEFFKKEWESIAPVLAREMDFRRMGKFDTERSILSDIAKYPPHLRSFDSITDLLKDYILLCEYSNLEEVIKPYYTARLVPSWKGWPYEEISRIIEKILEKVQVERKALTAAVNYKQEYDETWVPIRRTITGKYKLKDKRYQGSPRVQVFGPKDFDTMNLAEAFIKAAREDYSEEEISHRFSRYRRSSGDEDEEEDEKDEPALIREQFRIKYFDNARDGLPIKPEARFSGSKYGPFFKNSLLDDFQNWFKKHGEGALVALCLLETVFKPRRWATSGSALEEFGYNCLCLPALVNVQPLDVLLSLDKLCEVLSSVNFLRLICWRYCWLAEGRDALDTRALKVTKISY